MNKVLNGQDKSYYINIVRTLDAAVRKDASHFALKHTSPLYIQYTLEFLLQSHTTGRLIVDKASVMLAWLLL